MAKDTNYANAMAIYQMYGSSTDLKTFCQQNKINYGKFYQYLRDNGALPEKEPALEDDAPRMCPVEITPEPAAQSSPMLESAEISFGQGLKLSRQGIQLSELVSIIAKVSKALC